MTYLQLRDLPRGTSVRHNGNVGMVVIMHTGEYATNKVDHYIIWSDGGRSWNLEVLDGDMLDCESDIQLA